MDRNYHIFSDGVLERKDDTVRLVTTDEEKKYIPVENTEAVYLHGQIDFNTRLMSFLNEEGVALHVFGWNDYYSGSVMPKRGQTSGNTIVEQVRAYDSKERRQGIATEIVRGSIHNMRTNLVYYNSRDRDLDTELKRFDEIAQRPESVESIDELMGVEATARKVYYRAFDEILESDFTMGKREFNPPPNEINSLISFGNSLVYANCVSAIRATALDPSISYLHEPGERRYSLSLDIADIFKPILSDRVLFRLINRNQIDEDDFESELGKCLLNDTGRKTYAKEFEETLERTIDHPDLNRKVSYQYLIRIEVYKLKKHLLTGEQYKSLHRWW